MVDINIRHPHAQELLCRIAQHGRRGCIDFENAPAGNLDQPEAITRGRKYAPIAVGGFGQRRLGVLAVGNVAHCRL